MMLPTPSVGQASEQQLTGFLSEFKTAEGILSYSSVHKGCSLTTIQTIRRTVIIHKLPNLDGRGTN